MRRGDNGSRSDSRVASGMCLLETERGRELEAFDSLPPAVRRAIAEAPFLISAEQTLTAHLMGWKAPQMVEHIEASCHKLAALNGTCPEAYEPGQALHLSPRRHRYVRHAKT